MSGYVLGETRYVKLLLEDTCIGKPPCGAGRTCSAGVCVDATVDPGLFATTRDRAPVAARVPRPMPEGSDVAPDGQALPDAGPPMADDPRSDAGAAPSAAPGASAPVDAPSPSAPERDASIANDSAPHGDARTSDASVAAPVGACDMAMCSQIVANIRDEAPLIATGTLEACCVTPTVCGVRILVPGTSDACFDPNNLFGQP